MVTSSPGARGCSADRRPLNPTKSSAAVGAQLWLAHAMTGYSPRPSGRSSASATVCALLISAKRASTASLASICSSGRASSHTRVAICAAVTSFASGASCGGTPRWRVEETSPAAQRHAAVRGKRKRQRPVRAAACVHSLTAAARRSARLRALRCVCRARTSSGASHGAAGPDPSTCAFLRVEGGGGDRQERPHTRTSHAQSLQTSL